MKKKLLGLALITPLLITGCTTTSHFGVPDRAASVPEWARDAEADVRKAESSPGASFCPDKIAKAKELGAKGMQAHWACRDFEARALLAEARKLAAEAEACGGPVTRRAELGADALFAFNSARLTRQGEASLDNLLQGLQGASVSSIEVIGHTDPFGSDAYNMRLSEQRANSVASYLASKGVPSDRIRAEGRGETQLKISQAECAAQGARSRPALIQCYQPNRRVDVTVNAAASSAQ